MGASHSSNTTKLYDPLILSQNSIKSKHFVTSSKTAEGYSCYFYYDGCNCDKYYSNFDSPISFQEISTPKRKKSSLKRSQSGGGKSTTTPSSSSSSLKRVHFKITGGGSKKNTISPQKEEAVAIMNSPFRGLRRTNSGNSGNSYPYPRTHTTVMVIPINNRVPSSGSSRTGEWSSTSSIADESPTSSLSAINFDGSNVGPSYGFDKRRPPLNRAIPPIPESKSNESIMSQASKSLAGTPCDPPKYPTLELVQEEDKSVVIENKMAQNLATKIATNIPPPLTFPPPPPTSLALTNLKNSTSVQTLPIPSNSKAPTKLKQPKEITKQVKMVHTYSDPPKSPLMSMAHSVRCRLTKFGTRFSRSDSHSRSPIRSSTSLISMKPTQIPKTKMAKSSSMEAARNVPSTSALNKSMINSSQKDEGIIHQNNSVPMQRSQITLIPSPCRSPRNFAPSEELPFKTSKISEDKISLPSTIQEVAEPTTVNSSAEPSPLKVQTIVITSPVSAATTTTSSSNTDTIYSSSRMSSSTRHNITSPDWSEEATSNAKTTAPSITAPTTTAAEISTVLSSPEKDKSAAEHIPPNKEEPSKKVEEKNTVVSKKNTKESAKSKSPATPKSQKSEKSSKTPKLAAKFGFGGGNKSSKTQKVLPSPKVKPKKGGSLIIKGNSEERRTEEEIVSKIPPRKSLSFDTQTKPFGEVRRNSEMKLIKRIEKSFIPLMPSSMHHHRVDNNKNVDIRPINNVRSVNNKNRRAPLAEFESTRVENSPAVELPPIGFDRLTSSPGQRRRAQQNTANATAAAARIQIPQPQTITTTTTTSTELMHDANGNIIVSVVLFDEEPTMKTNLSAASPIQTRTAIENNEKLASAIKLDNDFGVSNMGSRKDSFDKTYFNGGDKKRTYSNLDYSNQIQRMETSADSIEERPKHSSKTETPLSTSYTSQASTSDIKTPVSSDQNANSTTKSYEHPPQISREDFDELKSKLSVLKNILEDQKTDNGDTTTTTDHSVEELSHENQILRQELHDRDRLIESLKQQLASAASIRN